MFKAADLIFTVFLNLFQGYCLQFFYGSFLDGRIKDSRWNTLAVTGLYPDSAGLDGILARLGL